MEYPMLTLDGGADPGYRGLLAHEVGHNWFFGMVGSNETYRAFLDEGFTQFLTAWALENIDGMQLVKGAANKYTAKHQLPEEVRYARAFQGYMRDAVVGDESTLNTHSDDFDGALRHGGGYGNVYYKTATMLYNLQYVLGDSLFLEAMQFYFDRWKIAHPYPEDFRAAIIDYTHADLNWFFDQWLETSKTIDYRIKKVKHKGEGKYAITLRRDGEMHMPIDLAVYDQSGTRYDYYIPNTWFVKNTTATVLPRWIGWGKLQPEYTAEIQLNNRIDNVVIDTTYRLADVRQFNNRMQKRGTLRLDSRVANPSDWKHYEFFIRPDLWYNHYDGLKTGFHVNGNYMRTLHRFEASFWLNSGLVRLRNGPEDQFNDYNLFSFALNYRTPTQKIVKNSSLLAEGRYLDGLRLGKLGWEVASRKGNTVFSLYLKYMERRDTTDVNYLMDRSVWNPNAINHTLNAGLQHTYEYMRGTGKIQLLLRTSAPGSVYDFSQAILESVNENYVGKLQIRTRFFAQYGTGSKLAPESALYLAGANPEQLMENKFTRSAAFFPQDFNGLGADVNHFHMGGGLNVRGYAGYLAPEQLANGNVILLNSGSSGAAGSVELEFDNLVKFKPRITRNWLKLDLYLFADAGILDSGIKGDKPQFERIRISSGFGTAWTIKRWGPFAMEKPLTLRFDMPLFLNRTPDVSPDYLQFRWVVGVNRAF
jgi:aminopeptidase N